MFKYIKTTIQKLYKNHFWHALIKNSLWAFIGDTGASIINIILSILLIHLIGSEQYGILILAESYFGIMDALLNLQSWRAVIQYGQKALASKHKGSLLSCFKQGFLIDFSTAIIGGIAAILIAPMVSALFDWTPELLICAQILSVGIFFHLSGTSTAILRLFDKFNMVAIQKITTAGLKLIIFLTMILFGVKIELIPLAIIYCSVDIVGNILLVIFAFLTLRKKYSTRLLLRAKTNYHFRQFITFSIWNTVESIADIPVNNLDSFLVSSLGTESVSIFKVFKQCINILRKMTSPIQQSILPQFSELAANRAEKQGLKAVAKIQATVIKICLPVAIFVGITSPLWLKLLYGEAFAIQWPILFIMLIIQTFALSWTAIHPYYTSLNKPFVSALIISIANMLYAGLLWLLVPSLALMAVPIAFAVQCFIAIYPKLWDSKRVIKLGKC